MPTAAGVYAEVVITLTECTLRANVARGEGGGVYARAASSAARLTLTRCTFRGTTVFVLVSALCRGESVRCRGVQLWCKANLEVVHALVIVIARELVRNTLKRGLALHNSTGIAKAFQVLDKAGIMLLEHFFLQTSDRVRR